MMQIKWTIAVVSLIFGLSFVSEACQAGPSAQPTVRGADSAGSYSAAALYDLGNSYARQGKPALAVLSYERARLLAPRDPDIRANLKLEQQSASLPDASTRFDDHFRILSPNAAYWLGLTGLIITGTCGLLLALRKAPRAACFTTLGIGLLMMAFTAGNAAATAPLMREAVVMQSAPASASPILNAKPLFTWSQATVVQVKDTHADFMLMRDSQGNAGWVRRGQVATVIDGADGNRLE